MIKKLLAGVFFSISSIANAQYAYAPVITLNMANYNDHVHWKQRVQLMADEIRQRHASIIVLQEVRMDPHEASSKDSHLNMAEQLLEILKNENEYKDARIVTQPVMYYGDKWEGLSIISTYPILETGTRFLNKTADCTDGNKRATQYAKIDVNGARYIIANTHFGLTHACVRENIRETVAYLGRIGHHDGMMLLGDFNTTPDNSDLARLAEIGLQDVWQHIHPDESGYTFPSNHPTSRIDYIFADDNLLRRIDSKDHVRKIGDHASDAGIYASDHLGLLAEVLAY